MDIRARVDQLHHLLGRSSRVVSVCRLVRNQANCIIGAYLGESTSAERNGERALLCRVAPDCRFFVDAGANVGTWSALFLELSPNATGVAYEPSPRTFAILKQRLQNKRIDFRNSALGDVSGEVVFVDRGMCSQTSAVEDVHIGSYDGHRIHVCMTTLDAEFGNLDCLIDYVKIDTEGYDFRVMLGARKLLQTGRIRYLQFEYGLGWLMTGCSLLRALECLGRFAYRIYLIRSTGLHPFCYERWGDYYRYSNFFACHEAWVDRLGDFVREPV